MLEENMIRWRKSVIREGRIEGRKEGRKEGEVEGVRRILLKQMELRFGPLPLPVRRRIREISSMAELEDLAGRLLTAASLSDLGLESTPR
jgi:predicted transposase YdaD